MAFPRLKRRIKPLLPGFWSLLAGLLLLGSIFAFVWAAGKVLVLR